MDADELNRLNAWKRKAANAERELRALRAESDAKEAETNARLSKAYVSLEEKDRLVAKIRSLEFQLAAITAEGLYWKGKCEDLEAEAAEYPGWPQKDDNCVYADDPEPGEK